jgi:hypothetical protein
MPRGREGRAFVFREAREAVVTDDDLLKLGFARAEHGTFFPPPRARWRGWRDSERLRES